MFVGFHPGIKGNTTLFCSCKWTTFGKSRKLGRAEANQKRKFSLLPVVLVGKLGVDLGHASNEKLLLLGRACLPIVRLRYGDSEPRLAGPLLV